MDLQVLQVVHMLWLEENFPQQQPADPLLGIVEEVGELAHAHLKASQSIRGTPEEHQAEARDAIGDIVIYLASYCNTNGYNFADCVTDAWTEVKSRNWQKYPQDGEGL